jgi:hypothetical protein
MQANQFRIEGIDQAALDPAGERVLIQATTTTGPLLLELPLNLLPRLVALSLHILGKSELASSREATALLPEGLEVAGFPDNRVGLRFLLPGGAPLTFLLDPEDARASGAGLVRHVDCQNPINASLN